jgi:hypothetical protein
LNLSVPVLMGIFIFLNPFPYTTAIKEIAFYGSVGIILILACFKKLEFSFRSPLSLPFGLFALWAFIGLFFALDKENSIHDFQTHLLKYLIFYYVLINYFDSRKRLSYLSWIIIIPVALVSLVMIIRFYGVLGNYLSTRLVTGMPEIAANGMGILVVPALLFSIHHVITASRLTVTAAPLISSIPLFVIILLIQARASIVAFLISIFILLGKYKKILVSILVILLVSTMMTSFKSRFLDPDFNTSLRLNTHYITSEIIKDYPLWGIGFGMETYGNRKFIDLETYNKRIPEKYRGYILKDPHSMPFSVAVRTGLIGLGLFLYMLFISFRMAWKCIEQKKDKWVSHWGYCSMAAMAGVLVIGFWEPFFSHVPEVVFYTLLAMITILWKQNKKDLAQ